MDMAVTAVWEEVKEVEEGEVVEREPGDMALVLEQEEDMDQQDTVFA